jgi:hypothetical protein
MPSVDYYGRTAPSAARSAAKGRDVMMDFRKIAVGLAVLSIAATTLTLARAQEATFSEGERLGLASCLVKCLNGDKACDNRCISQSQTKGRVWSDDVRACIRGCRVTAQMLDVVISCITGCRLDRTFQ